MPGYDVRSMERSGKNPPKSLANPLRRVKTEFDFTLDTTSRAGRLRLPAHRHAE